VSIHTVSESASFLVARNPQEDSRLPYLLRLPLEGGLILKARATWPARARVYCHRFEKPWPEDADIVEKTPALACRRRGAAIDLVLHRPRLTRSQFVFTQVKGGRRSSGKRRRPPAPRTRRPDPAPAQPRRAGEDRGRHPRALPLPLRTARRGDGARDRFRRRLRHPLAERRQLAAVERKSLDNLASTLSDGTLAFQLQRLAELPLAAVVVEARYAALFKLAHVNGDWLADQLARLEVRYPEVTIVFADSRRYAEDWTYRFLATALADTTDPTRTPNTLHVDWRRLPVPREITICEPYRVIDTADRTRGSKNHPANVGARPDGIAPLLTKVSHPDSPLVESATTGRIAKTDISAHSREKRTSRHGD
jgi:hypothetical protein